VTAPSGLPARERSGEYVPATGQRPINGMPCRDAPQAAQQNLIAAVVDLVRSETARLICVLRSACSLSAGCEESTAKEDLRCSAD
jgi:hypothetical protein